MVCLRNQTEIKSNTAPIWGTTTMKQIILTNLGNAQNPQNIVIRVNMVRHDDLNKPFRVTKRTPIEIKAQDGPSSYYLGRLPISEYRTVPSQKERGRVVKQFFSQLEITVAAPEGTSGINCFTKWFYPRPGGLREISGFKLGCEILFSQRCPIEHLGQTAQSRIGTNESRNNIYVAICGEGHFVAYAISVVAQENGVWLVYAPVYSGEVFKDKTGVRCPLLEDERTGGTREAFLPLVQKWYDKAELEPVPDGFQPHPPINVSHLKNGGNQTENWSEVVIHMESPARQLSFGLAKDLETDEACFVYVNWDELAGALPDKRIKRVPFGSVVKGWIKVEGGGRYKLTRIQFLPKSDATERWITAYEMGEKNGASHQDPEWIQKRKARLGAEANIGQQFAGTLNELLLSMGA